MLGGGAANRCRERIQRLLKVFETRRKDARNKF
jgi:hypothetical protein